MAPALKWIQAISAGDNHLALPEIARRGIGLRNGRGVQKIHMAEYAIAAMIDLARGFHCMLRNQLHKRWDRAMQIIEHNLSVYLSGRGDMINVVDAQTG